MILIEDMEIGCILVYHGAFLKAILAYLVQPPMAVPPPPPPGNLYVSETKSVEVIVILEC